MPDQNDEKPKIIVDDDWKAQARKEQEEQDRMTQEAGEQSDLPEPSILEIVQLVVMQATIGLGLVQDPQSGKPIPPSLPLAKHYIDLLDVLSQKTAGNLDEAEKEQVDSVLHQLRMAYVEVTNAMAQAAEQGMTGDSPPQA